MRSERERGGRRRGAGMKARVSFQNNREATQSEQLLCTLPRSPQQCYLQLCAERAIGTDPLCCPPHGKHRACRCGRRTGLCLNTKAEIWENPAWVPAQPQPLCDLSGGSLQGSQKGHPHMASIPEKSTQSHGHSGLEFPCL